MSGAGIEKRVELLAPGRLWSLWDMLNCSVSSLFVLGSQLTLEHIARDPDLMGNRLEDLRQSLDDEELKQARGWMKIARSIAEDFEIAAAIDRIDIIEKDMKTGMSRQDLSVEYRVLQQTFQKGFNRHFIYRYPSDKAKVFESWTEDWSASINAFPSAKADIRCAVDLWAMSHPTASVFHSMRVLEHGLRAMAKDLDVPFSVEVWQTVIDSMEKKIREVAPSLPRGAAKAERLQFLASAAKEFYYFKDGWRNYVSHNKASYDEFQARSVLEHVRVFMNSLSAHFTEVVAS